MIRALIVQTTLVTCFVANVHCLAGEWRAGTAKEKITPKEFMLMAGYGSRTEPADGKLTELWAKALVMEDAAGQRGLLITLDLVGIDRVLSKRICDSLQSQHGFKRQQIAICTSHTHTGPAVGMNLGPLHYLVASPENQKQIDAYAKQLHEKVVGVVNSALDELQSVQIHWGVGRSTFAVNRRENKPYERVPQWRTEGVLKGPVDHAVPVLTVRDDDGNLKSILFGYACHATVLGVRQWSGDYPGYAQIELEQRHPECVAMFWAGCGADQNPLPRKTIGLAKHYGRCLAQAVEAVVLTSEMRPVTGELRMEYREIDLPLSELPTKDQLISDTQSANRFVAARANMLLKQLKTGSLSQTYPYPISCWTIGDEVQFVLLGGEVVVDYAIRLKTEHHGENTWVAGYANDVMAYIPSRRVLLEGGYEGGGAMVYYGLPTVWAPQVEEDIVNEVRRQLTELDPS